ncbi:4'-phosphopantetheinyl transferase superfamily protein [Pontibacillus sp. ALD_SL1]|uniref:4'-phosphopantetheinyl transferase family protein n=1 Tax=Pontibacillus sp. ALD_SL1 TaxID=2777185 RepID=UPI001A9576F9|nr:4'-phosphopantetheinyl transferase superfamily protein [Pontibacillus sp. ALD_SL1]QST01046.1 4'-phosphopantetheinyl transferase superfamily protein [Pontibacillus sp. ALD_SL1]
MVKILVCHLKEERIARKVEELYPYLSRDRIEQLRKLHQPDDRFRSAIGDLLIRFAFSNVYGQTLEWDSLKRTAYGKPYLPDYPSFHFNTSHAGDWIACAIHHAPVGVDVEEIKPIQFDFAKGVFTENEYKRVVEHPDPLSAFYQTWTAKESVVKADGRGLSYPLSSFEVAFQQDGRVNMLNDEREYRSRTYSFQEEYVLTVCAEQVSQLPDRFIEIEYDSLIQMEENTCLFK